MVRRSVLQELNANMARLNRRFDDFQKYYSATHPIFPSDLSNVSLDKMLSLPDHLRRTYIAVAQFQRPISAVEVCGSTGRCRAIESNYLNILVRLGWLTKLRVDREMMFRPVATGLVIQK